MTSLRQYQRTAIEAIVNNVRDGNLRQAVVMPTGAGKTVIFAHLPEALCKTLPGKMLVLVHRKELVQQAADKIRSYNPNLKVGVEQAENRADSDCDVLVASVVTLGRQNSERHSRHDWSAYSIVVVDECHHATAETYERLLKRVNMEGKLILGFTATPGRTDKADLSHLFGRDPVYQMQLIDAICSRWLSDLRAIRVYTDTSLDEVETKENGDLAEESLSKAINTPERNRAIVTGGLIRVKTARQSYSARR